MISIIIPVLNEKELIRPFFNHLNQLEGDFELILVDGGSSDGTINEINKERDVLKHKLQLLKTHQGRGHQMNKGASTAKGDILLFLHIDCKLEIDAIPTIEKEVERQNIVGGGMIQAFSNTDDFLKFVSNFGNMRARVTKTFFGDFGIFLKKDVFEKIGGYDDIPFLEDVEICYKAKKVGKLEQIDRVIYTSPRRFKTQGNIKISIIFSITLMLNIIGYRPKFLIKYIVDK
jgi:rSAM/selenodomain-associated transferase 2